MQKEVFIWNPETRITDLDADEKELLSTTEIPGIKAAWRGQRWPRHAALIPGISVVDNSSFSSASRSVMRVSGFQMKTSFCILHTCYKSNFDAVVAPTRH